MYQQSTSFCGEFEIDSPALAPLISYPRYSKEDYSRRISEMESLGVQSIIVGNGKSTVNGISIAGKGCVGLVFKAKSTRHEIIALKVRRLDADRPSMEREASLHRIANGAGVGPALIGHTDNLVAMEFVEGQSIRDWVRTVASASEFRKVAKSVLDQCCMLDSAGLDHGELSRLGRHVIISGKGIPYVIDFESASTTRRTTNVTSAAQSLFLYGGVAVHSKRFFRVADTERALGALRKYKKSKSHKDYKGLVESLDIAF